MKYTLLFALIVYSAVSSTAQTFSVLHDFAGESGAGRCVAGLTLANGTLYGAAAEGGLGEPSGGAIFSIKPDGSEFRLLYSFNGSEIAAPSSTLTLEDDTLYGTAIYGTNQSSDGAIFKIGTNGTDFSVLHQFDGTNGSSPNSPLILSSNMLYGTTALGGVSNAGTIFRINSDGTAFATLHSFTSGDDGANPSRLVLNGDTLYGITGGGGTSNHGTLFRIGTNGTDFTTLHNFQGGDRGANPRGSLILSGETLYGITEFGGNFPGGTIFSIKTNGADFTTIHDFISSTNEGSHPIGLLLFGGTLYGTTESGILLGDNVNSGTVYEIDTNGSNYKLLYSFTELSGAFPLATNIGGSNPSEILLLDGVLFGTTIFGGTSGNGTIFSVSLPEPLLRISHFDGNVVLKWATNVPGFTLQSATNLLSPVWNPVLPSPTVINGQNMVTNSISDVQRFYRLSQ